VRVNGKVYYAAGKILEVAEQAKNMGKEIRGLHQHIGSGWLGSDINDFQSTVDETLAIYAAIEKVNGTPLRFVDFGGGPGIRYKESDEEFPWQTYFDGICSRVARSSLGFEAIEIEPSRSVFGDAGILLLNVNNIERKSGNLIIYADGGFDKLIRPKLYDASMQSVNCKRTGRFEEATVVGPLCETGDILTVDKIGGRKVYRRLMEIPEEGDPIAITHAGAYGYEMGSNYNKWPLPARVMVYDGKAYLVGKRQTFEQLMNLEVSLDEAMRG
jgi:diaminopimelate decarboxylase